MNETKEYNLPKWPQMLVSGRPVTEDQAKEIIRRTDSFMRYGHGGNDHEWDADLKRRLGMPNDDYGATRDMTPEQRNAHWRRLRAWQEAWGCVETEYVTNSWISCAFIGGPHGWCHPDGRIQFADNVGKWPSSEAVLTDWSALAGEFPFLHLAATLMSGESCEDQRAAVCTILVRGGEAVLVDGDLSHHAEYGMVSTGGRDPVTMAMTMHLPPRYREHYPIQESWYAEWAERGQAIARELDAKR